MRKKPENTKLITDNAASRPDEKNPEWTAQDVAEAKPARDVLATYIGEAAAAELLNRRPGRPPKEDRKINQTLRLDADVVEAYRQSGKGWQTKMNNVLRRNMPR